MYHSSKSRFFLPFLPVTWEDLDLYYGHEAQEIILTDVSDTIHADSLPLFALNTEILLADVTKPEKSKILTLTWPVTSSVTCRSFFLSCSGNSRRELSNGVCNLGSGPVVWEISGGPLPPPPPQRCERLQRASFQRTILSECHSSETSFEKLPNTASVTLAIAMLQRYQFQRHIIWAIVLLTETHCSHV